MVSCYDFVFDEVFFAGFRGTSFSGMSSIGSDSCCGASLFGDYFLGFCSSMNGLEDSDVVLDISGGVGVETSFFTRFGSSTACS